MKATEKKILQVCALAYKTGMQAPVVRAFGKNEMAEKILELARRHQIDIKSGESEELLALLSGLEVNQQIPAELYQAVARIFAFFYLQKN